MKLNPACVMLCTCLLAAPISFAQAQDEQQTPQTPQQQTTVARGTLPPPKFVPSEVNTGRGFSIEPFYWMGTYNPALRTGDKFSSATTNSGDLDFSTLKPRYYGALVSIPASKTSMVRVSYFQGKASDLVFAPGPITLFKVADAAKGDPISADLRLTQIKATFDYLTYYWTLGKSELRFKTLWEMQRIGATTDVTVFPILPDGTIDVPKPAGHDFNIILPTLGVGFEHTLNRHFRWEAKATGMYFGSSHSRVLDTDATLNFRYGRFEIAAGGRLLNFRTSKNDEHYLIGNTFGPFVGLRYYWRKERPTSGTASAPTR